MEYQIIKKPDLMVLVLAHENVLISSEITLISFLRSLKHLRKQDSISTQDIFN